MNGKVQSGGSSGNVLPIANVSVHLYEAVDGGTLGGPLVTSDANGAFTFPSMPTSAGIYYVIANERSQTPLMALIGPELPPFLTINELTTVAAVYCVAQFLNPSMVMFGPSHGVRVAAAMYTNVVDVNGASSPILVNSPNADQTNARRLTGSLANLLAWCVRAPQNCARLFQLTTLPNGDAPANLIQAMLNIAHDPLNEATPLYQQSKVVPQVFTPSLQQDPAPDAWTLAVKVNDSGDNDHMFGGPGNLAFDSKGRAWITNNVNQGTGDSTQYCIVLDAAGRPAVNESGQKISPFTGGGLLGTGYGVALDSKENVWFGNFGWGKVNPSPTGSMSKFTSEAEAVSPDWTSSAATGGYQSNKTPNYYRVQGVAVDSQDNVWIAGWKSHTVAVFTAVTSNNPGINDPIIWNPNDDDFDSFGIAIASDDTAWVVNANKDQSSMVQLKLDPVARKITAVKTPPPFGKQAKGIAIDSVGNIWVASGGDDYVYAFESDGTPIGQYNAGQIWGPWGVAIDGDDSVWVANFGPLAFGNQFTGRLTHLVGANQEKWPQGTSTGYVLSPAKTGYTLPTQGAPVLLADLTPLYGDDGPAVTIPFMRNTACNIDAAGNVWCCNNWKPIFTLDLVGDPFEGEAANPGGDGMVIFVGMAKPRS